MFLQDYLRLRNLGFSRKQSVQYSNSTQHFLKTIWQVTYWTFIIGVFVYWTSDYANAKGGAEKQSHYVHDLEKVVGQCLKEKGGLIKVGNEWFICEAYSIGDFNGRF